VQQLNGSVGPAPEAQATSPSRAIPVFRPQLGEEEIEALREVFRSGWIGLGPQTAKFEEKFATFVNAKHAVAVNSATAGLHLACLGLDLRQGDEVLVPTMTFVSTAHAVVLAGGAPTFVDIDPETLNISVEDAERRITPRTRAIVVVHYGGHAAPMDEVWEFARRHNLVVIEDAAHACGTLYRGAPVGGLDGTDVTVFSFHAVKNLATGDGGMLTTNRDDRRTAYDRLKWVGIDRGTWDRTLPREDSAYDDLRQFARYGWYYEVHGLGYKYHMNDITAAIGLCQLAKLPDGNARRREIAATYRAALAGITWIELPLEHSYTRSAQHNFVIKSPYRDALNTALMQAGISTGVHYMPIHLQPYYRSTHTTLPVAEQVWRTLLTLPLYPSMTASDVDRVIDGIRRFIPPD